MFERPLPEIQTGVPVRPVTLDVGIRTFAKLSDGGESAASGEAGGAERAPQDAARGVLRQTGIEEPREEEDGAPAGFGSASIAGAEDPTLAQYGRQIQRARPQESGSLRARWIVESTY